MPRRALYAADRELLQAALLYANRVKGYKVVLIGTEQEIDVSKFDDDVWCKTRFIVDRLNRRFVCGQVPEVTSDISKAYRLPYDWDAFTKCLTPEREEVYTRKGDLYCVVTKDGLVFQPNRFRLSQEDFKIVQLRVREALALLRLIDEKTPVCGQ